MPRSGIYLLFRILGLLRIYCVRLFFGVDLTESEMKRAINTIKLRHPELSSAIVNVIGVELPRLKTEFQEYSDKKVNFLKFYIQTGNISQGLGEIAINMEISRPAQQYLRESSAQWSSSRMIYAIGLELENSLLSSARLVVFDCLS